MARPLSVDLRTRVLNDVESGMSAERAAVKYSISARTIYQWKALKRETGSLAPRSGKSGPQPKLEPYREQILAAVQENSGITLKELRAQLQLPGCLSTVWNALRTWGIVLKKSPAGRRTAAA